MFPSTSQKFGHTSTSYRTIPKPSPMAGSSSGMVDSALLNTTESVPITQTMHFGGGGRAGGGWLNSIAKFFQDLFEPIFSIFRSQEARAAKNNSYIPTHKGASPKESPASNHEDPSESESQGSFLGNVLLLGVAVAAGLIFHKEIGQGARYVGAMLPESVRKMGGEIGAKIGGWMPESVKNIGGMAVTHWSTAATATRGTVFSFAGRALDYGKAFWPSEFFSGVMASVMSSSLYNSAVDLCGSLYKHAAGLFQR